MQLQPSEDQRLVRDSFAAFFRKELPPSRVREAELSGGFDTGLWQSLIALGAPLMRVPADKGGSESGVLDAVFVAAEYGRYLAPVPLLEVLVAARLLAAFNRDDLLELIGRGERRVGFMPLPIATGDRVVVPNLCACDSLIALCDNKVALFAIDPDIAMEANLGRAAIAHWQVPDQYEILGEDTGAIALFQGAAEEWKLLTASAAVGAAQRAMEIASDYANEREAFGRPIGSYQGIAHPLADSACDVDGAELLIWRAVSAIANDEEEADSLVSQVWWWVSEACPMAAHRSLRTLGGYGLTLEYDSQLYLRRIKTWVLLCGNPESALDDAGERLFLDQHVALPPAGEVSLEFGLGEQAQAYEEETRNFFEQNLTPELKKKRHHSTASHDPEFHKQLAAAGLIFGNWPVEQGGRGYDGYIAHAASRVFEEVNWSSFMAGTSGMVAGVIQLFGSDEAKRDILPRIRSGEIICSLGFSEPSCGSDVFAAKTSAVKDGDEWIINGQKMFTTGAHIADYVLLLTRTDPDAKKHAGITLFLVPLKADGVAIHKVETLMGERTNITYYQDVRVADAMRLGDVNAGVFVMIKALESEHSGAGYHMGQISLWLHAMQWASAADANGKRPLDSADIRRGLARVRTRINVSETLMFRSLWASEEGVQGTLYGPKSKLFASESYTTNSWELMKLAAPFSLFEGREGLGGVEQGHRRAYGTTIYGGTSEIHRSRIAESALGLPRTRG